MGRLRAKSDYEDLRNARILENQARLASLGLQKTVSELRSITSSPKDKTRVRKYSKVAHTCTPVRRSNRLKLLSPDSTFETISLRRSFRLNGMSNTSSPSPQAVNVRDFEDWKGQENRPANAPLVKVKGSPPRLSPDALARRCTSPGRGGLYDPVFGICCHFCRQKKLCGEEDCERCGNLDVHKPCIGKTYCSVCHSSNGVLCHACLKVRYGEEMEEVRAKKEWRCPHCVEDEGINLFWICNSSLCLKKRKMVPTGIAIFRAREMGYKSVAHLLMDELQQQARN